MVGGAGGQPRERRLHAPLSDVGVGDLCLGGTAAVAGRQAVLEAIRGALVVRVERALEHGRVGLDGARGPGRDAGSAGGVDRHLHDECVRGALVVGHRQGREVPAGLFVPVADLRAGRRGAVAEVPVVGRDGSVLVSRRARVEGDLLRRRPAPGSERRVGDGRGTGSAWDVQELTAAGGSISEDGKELFYSEAA